MERIMAKRADVAADSRFTDHGRRTRALDRPVKQVSIQLLGASSVAAPDFEVNHRIWHFYIIE
jgi:hypothetical protein